MFAPFEYLLQLDSATGAELSWQESVDDAAVHVASPVATLGCPRSLYRVLRERTGGGSGGLASPFMVSWRDSASQQSQDDLDGLLNEALPLAEEMLAKNGEFYPYAVVRTDAGEREMLAGWTGDENPPSDEVLPLLLEGARQRSLTLRAVALVADVRANGGDAIRVELEHCEGPVMTVFLAYKKRRFRRGVDFGAMSAGAADRRVW